MIHSLLIFFERKRARDGGRPRGRGRGRVEEISVITNKQTRARMQTQILTQTNNRRRHAQTQRERHFAILKHTYVTDSQKCGNSKDFLPFISKPMHTTNSFCVQLWGHMLKNAIRFWETGIEIVIIVQYRSKRLARFFLVTCLSCLPSSCADKVARMMRLNFRYACFTMQSQSCYTYQHA